jgi:hypothetical protein
MNSLANSASAPSQTDIPFSNKDLPSLADACMVFTHAPCALVPVALGKLEFLQYELHKAVIIVTCPLTVISGSWFAWL